MRKPQKSANCRPVFLVGMNGSGTTMLRDSLCRHPKLYGFPKEIRLLPRLLKKVEHFGSLDDDENFLKAWEEVRNLPAVRFANSDRKPPLPTNWKNYPRNIEVVIDAVLRDFSKQDEKERWCEKSPQNVQHLPLLARTFPHAKFVHIIRDGRDCAASFHRRWGRSPELSIYRWKEAVRKGREDGNKLGGNYLELKYEEITQDPEYWMRRICEHIGIVFHPDVLVSKHPNHELSKGILGRIEPNSGKWKTYFTRREIAQLESISGSFLRELGYPSVANVGDKNPTRFELVRWRLADYSKQYRSEISDKIRGKSHKSWVNVINLPRGAIEHWRMNKY